MDRKRETLTSNLGFLLVSAGCAVGLGNVWRFPYIVGEYGGALFVLLYIFFLVMFGLPMMTAEFAFGRASKSSIAKSYIILAPEAKGFRTISKFQIAANWVLMMFYTTVAGWMIAYPVAILNGWFDIRSVAEVDQYAQNFFGAFVASAPAQILWVSVICLIGFGICALGLRQGVEDITKKMMSVLFLILIGLCGYALTLEGAMEGVKFYLVPNLDALKDHSIFEIIHAALGQSFFTLSLGIGSMSIFGSYTSRAKSLAGQSAYIITIDTIIALLSGLIIFPACFAYNVQPSEGPGLIFFALPKVFAQMPGGLWVGAIFFIFLALAAITTIVTVFENIIAMTMEGRRCSRHVAIKRNAPLLFLLSLPCALSFGLLSDISIAGKGILDLEDLYVSNFALPLGSLAILIFCVSRKYWSWERFRNEANAGTGLKIPNGLRLYMAVVIPLVILFIFISSLWNVLKPIFVTEETPAAEVVEATPAAEEVAPPVENVAPEAAIAVTQSEGEPSPVAPTEDSSLTPAPAPTTK